MIIRSMNKIDSLQVIDMMKIFYSSPAVHTNGSEDIFKADVENCINDSPYLEGYVFEENGSTVGYAMLAKSFSTEFGRQCIWIEDIYVKEEYRNLGIGKIFLDYVDSKYSDSIIRLEVEEENEHAFHVYRKSGYDILPYLEMYKNK